MKRRLAMFICMLALFAVMALPVSAQSTASRIDSFCTINADGDCLVNMTVTLHLENASDHLRYPLPPAAEDITVNKGSARVEKTPAASMVDLSKFVAPGMTGDISIQFDYTIPGIVTVDEELVKKEEKRLKEEQERREKENKKAPGDSNEKQTAATEAVPDPTATADPAAPRETQPRRYKPLLLDLPILCGFSFPVEHLNFTIYMPGPVPAAPKFYSTYHQNSVESILPFVVDGQMITGSSTAVLNDHEGVNMSMVVSEKMFPNVSVYERTGNPEVYFMIAFALAALIYWVVFLRTAPLRRYHNVTPPEGITAGELGCRLTLAGGDLTMMVLSWAQLGYLLIREDKAGRIILHKRMDMSNERSLFEIRIFKSLFGSRTSVDATGVGYAKLVRKVARMVPGEKFMCTNNAGSMKVFRALAALVHGACGVCVAFNMTAIFALQIILSIILGAFGLISGWEIQEIAYRTHLRGKMPVFVGGGLCLVWILLGLLCGQVWIPLVSVLGQFLFSYFAAYGGRRSDINRHDVSQILGLRHYMKKVPQEELQHAMEVEPDYFFELAPYALALGILRPFAKNFRKKKWDMCPYMIPRRPGRRTAEEWAVFLRSAADRMDQRAQRMALERWLPIRFR